MTTNELLSIANYVRYETIIDGQRAAWLDAKQLEIVNGQSHLADMTERVKTAKRPEMLGRMIERARTNLENAINELATWLRELKQARPNLPYEL